MYDVDWVLKCIIFHILETKLIMANFSRYVWSCFISVNKDKLALQLLV